METVSLSKAQKELDSLLDRAVEIGEPLVIKRKGKPDVALVAAANLNRTIRPKSADPFYSRSNQDALRQSLADAQAGICGWTGTCEEFQDLSEKMMATSEAIDAGKKRAKVHKKRK